MPSVLDVIENAGKEIGSLPGDLEKSLSTVDEVEAFLQRQIISSAVNGLDVAGEAAVAGAGDALGGIISVVGVLSLTVVAAAIGYAFDRIYHAVDRLPGPLRTSAHVFLAATFPVQTIVDYAARKAGSVVGSFLHHWNTVTTVSKAVSPQIAGPPLPTAAEFSHIETIKQVDNALASIQYEIDILKYQLSHVNGHPVTNVNNTQVTNNINPQVWPEIHSLQSAVSHLQSAVVQVYADIRANSDRIEQIGHELGTLSAEIGNVRTVTAGWQDVQQVIQQTLQTLEHKYTDVEESVQHQAQQLRQLAPLGLLLQPGIRGLRVLRSLEDKPCQCPQFGSIPNELGTALALIEFIENG